MQHKTEIVEFIAAITEANGTVSVVFKKGSIIFMNMENIVITLSQETLRDSSQSHFRTDQ